MKITTILMGLTILVALSSATAIPEPGALPGRPKYKTCGYPKACHKDCQRIFNGYNNCMCNKDVEGVGKGGQECIDGIGKDYEKCKAEHCRLGK